MTDTIAREPPSALAAAQWRKDLAAMDLSGLLFLLPGSHPFNLALMLANRGRDYLADGDGCHLLALELFLAVDERHGRQFARRLFAQWGTPPSPRRRAAIEARGVLDMLDLMKPAPNVQELARRIAQHNEDAHRRGKREECIGPRGSTSVIAIERYIKRARAERDAPDNERGWCHYPQQLPYLQSKPKPKRERKAKKK